MRKLTDNVILSLGSNIGDRRENIKSALMMLSEAGFEKDSVSSFYETEPVGYKEQSDFLNIAVSGNYSKSPEDLLTSILEIEERLGRKRAIRFGPRTIDIDIIFFKGRRYDLEDLKIPHPEYRNRKFVLAPMIEIEPELKDCVTGESLKEILVKCQDGTMIRKIT
jgi:2-amino-4-hydroxy-6-hydroxymethyldihydropteridine diphosphokinase